MTRRLLTLALLAIACRCAMAQPRHLNYLPDGNAFVCYDGNNRYTRALYGGTTDFRLETSDRPVFAAYKKTGCCNVRFIITTHGHDAATLTVAADTTDHCEARYTDGRRDYIVRHDAWGDATLSISTVAPADREGAVWRMTADGFGMPLTLRMVVAPIKAKRLHRSGDLGVDAPDSFEADTDERADTMTLSLTPGDTLYVALRTTTDDSGRPLYSPTTLLSPTAYDTARAYLDSIARRVTFSTPDAFINTLGSALTIAADGCWDGQTWLHGCVGWRMPLPGWRAAYAGDVLGWPERAITHFNAYARSQVTDVPVTDSLPAPDTLMNLARAEKRWGTRMYSNGYICRDPGRNDRMHHYDMNLCYVDELLWHFCYDADTAYMRRMWPLLTSHSEWERRNFDADDDGLYDAYCCIWASDALYYSGGAVTHSTAYNYRCQRLMARIATLIGEDPTPYATRADKILTAMNSRLWTDDGPTAHWAEYIEATGYRRRHDAAALWSVYTPIDCGAGTPSQCYDATRYVDNCLPHIAIETDSADIEMLPLPPGTLCTLATSDWMPYAWSINNVAAAEVMHTALAYFQAGRHEEGYRLMMADILDGMYLGRSPANFGQLSYYDAARGECYRDFGDCIGISARTLLQGLFGIVPQALDGRCVIRPGFPDEWDTAAVTTPYLSYSFRREGDNDIYEVEQHLTQPLTVVVRRNLPGGEWQDITGTDEVRQTITVPRTTDTKNDRQDSREPSLSTLSPLPSPDDGQDTTGLLCSTPPAASSFSLLDIDTLLNADIPDIFNNDYLSPRPQTTTLQIPRQGVGEWCHPLYRPEINDSVFRSLVTDDCFTAAGVPFRTHAQGNNIAYCSLFDNYPDSLVILPTTTVKASTLFFLLAGSTNHMQSRIDNALITVTYDDGNSDTLHLQNPDSWCPIEQDYYDDGRAFRLNRRPWRIGLATGIVSRHPGRHPGIDGPDGREIPGGAAMMIDMPVDSNRAITAVTVLPLAPDIVVGLIAVTAGDN